MRYVTEIKKGSGRWKGQPYIMGKTRQLRGSHDSEDAAGRAVDNVIYWAAVAGFISDFAIDHHHLNFPGDYPKRSDYTPEKLDETVRILRELEWERKFPHPKPESNPDLTRMLFRELRDTQDTIQRALAQAEKMVTHYKWISEHALAQLKQMEGYLDPVEAQARLNQYKELCEATEAQAIAEQKTKEAFKAQVRAAQDMPEPVPANIHNEPTSAAELAKILPPTTD
jgi:hypothetical protein